MLRISVAISIGKEDRPNVVTRLVLHFLDRCTNTQVPAVRRSNFVILTETPLLQHERKHIASLLPCRLPEQSSSTFSTSSVG